MKARGRLVAAFLVVTTVSALGPRADARTPKEVGRRLTPIVGDNDALSLDSRAAQRGLRAAAAADTTLLAAWTFDGGGSCVAEGWTSVDRTEQLDDYFHVDDFAGLGGGDFGRLVALEGNQSMWCGARPSTALPYCSYAALPGYGNSWDQYFRTDCFSVTGDVVVDYLIAWDSEPNYDWSTLYADTCEDRLWRWMRIDGGWSVWEGVGSGFYSSVVPDSLHNGTLRLRFRFESDPVWSDEDGIFETDGAVIIDSLTVSDALGTVLPTETFESESPGDKATLSGNWTADRASGYGDFAGLFHGIDVLQEDACKYNASCLWGFFSGSTRGYDCGYHPEQPVVPYENLAGQYIDNEIRSPWTTVTGTGNTWELAFDVYRDLPLDAGVVYVWHVRSLVGGCPGPWRDRNFVYFGNKKDWYRYVAEFSDLVDPGATDVQVALGVMDMCGVWYCFGDWCHSQAPLFDNVEIRRIDSNGPRWSVQAADLFQDSFAGDGTTTGTVRADIARDLHASANPGIRPGDSLSVTVFDSEGQLVGDTYTGFGSAAYLYVNVRPEGQLDKAGAALTSDAFRWPVVDAFSFAGNMWQVVRMDTAFINSAARSGVVPNSYCVDLNDNLFTPGDTISYLFGATGGPGAETTYYSSFTGTTDDAMYAFSNPMEFTCLPTKNVNDHYPTSYGGMTRPILYVDGYDGLGAQPAFDAAFDALGITDAVDRYDILSPSSREGNHPGARVVDVAGQLLAAYRMIFWNTGDLEYGTLGDGIYYNEKSDDAGMLLAFLDHVHTGGVYLSGDNIAEEWVTLANDAVPLRNTYMQHTLISPDHMSKGFGVSPLVIGEDDGIFDHLTGPDTLVAFGGCPTYTDFDVLAPQGAAVQEMRYNPGVPGQNGAVLAQYTDNLDSVTVGVVLSGFSFHRIRDEQANSDSDERAHHLEDIMKSLGAQVVIVPGVLNPTLHSALAQNYPNPFNPTTTLEFTVREKTRVTLRVYNVRGQLVKTLVDDVRTPGVVHRVEWDGRNDAGQQVASGVYFYRMTTREFTRTRKMVLLK